ncbi:hypothetical protein Q1695_016364 [Nippostrongylus brasiliensis]|nr:hypothetical protein Q1695_016364 [Nippostrongylus brasiliensis]
MTVCSEGSDQQVDRLGVDVPMVKMITMGIDPIGSVGFRENLRVGCTATPIHAIRLSSLSPLPPTPKRKVSAIFGCR